MSNPLRMTPETMRLAAHRGHSAGAPENTYASFKLAREICGPGVTCETDLALTRDGEMVLIHDETVDRTDGKLGGMSDDVDGNDGNSGAGGGDAVRKPCLCTV